MNGSLVEELVDQRLGLLRREPIAVINLFDQRRTVRSYVSHSHLLEVFRGDPMDASMPSPCAGWFESA